MMIENNNNFKNNEFNYYLIKCYEHHPLLGEGGEV